MVGECKRAIRWRDEGLTVELALIYAVVELENLLDRAAETQRKLPCANQSGVACQTQPHRPEARLPEQPREGRQRRLCLLPVACCDCVTPLQRLRAVCSTRLLRCPPSNEAGKPLGFAEAESALRSLQQQAQHVQPQSLLTRLPGAHQYSLPP
jgi:hypothetical protein